MYKLLHTRSSKKHIVYIYLYILISKYINEIMYLTENEETKVLTNQENIIRNQKHQKMFPK